MDRVRPTFGGRIGTTIAESAPWWEANGPSPSRLPNILQIVLDDTGWADFGCFGSEIDTPHIDSLAGAGVRYSNFHVTPLCSPTRACLFTGRNHHRVGMRFLADIDTGFPNSRGRIDPALPMVPAQLAAGGYGTYLIGKWHLAPQHEITPAGPFRNWPLARGFDRFFGFLDGCTDQFAPELYEDNHLRAERLPEGKHLTTELVDRGIRMLADHVLYRPHDPFYLTFAPGATHAPFQAPADLIEKYVPVFEKGWDATRDARLARQTAAGLTPEGTLLTPPNPGVPAWADLGTDERRLYTRQQAAFAAFLEHTDAEIGRLLAQLDRLGLRENTLIMVMSDNGASREGGRHGAVDVNAPYSGRPEPLTDQLARIDEIGGPFGPAHYPEGWAMAGNTPFRRYKQSVDLGGVRSPLVVCWPKGITVPGIRAQFAHVIDLAATVMDVSGLRGGAAMDGVSLRNSFASPTAAAPRTTQYWEMFGHRAIWQDGWKAVTEHQPGAPYDDDVWRLYDTRADFAENQDLAGDQPDRLADLIQTWWREARSNDVLPLDDRPLPKLLNETRTPNQLASRMQLVLRPENSHVPVSTGVASAGRRMRITARLLGRASGQGGILASAGTRPGGLILYVAGNDLVFEHCALGRTERISAGVAAGNGDLGVEIRPQGDSTRVILLAEGHPIGEQRMTGLLAHPSFWGLDIGTTAASPPCGATVGRFPQGMLDRVTIDFHEELTSEEMADVLARAE